MKEPLLLTILAIVLLITFPFLIVYLSRKNKFLASIGAITICYILGFACSTLSFSGISYDKSLTETIAYVLVALSIPLILFSIDLKEIKKLTKNVIVGYALCILSTFIVSFMMFFIFNGKLEKVAELAAMTVGLYTGGTPNLNAIGALFNVGSNIISAANVSDSLVGGIYFLFAISLAPKVYAKLLKRNNEEKVEITTTNISKDDYQFGISFKDKKAILKLVGSFFLAVGCIGVGAILELLIEGTIGSNLIYILLSVSILGIIFSFIKPIRDIKGQYTLGLYLILMFSIALSMSINWEAFLGDILPVLLFFLIAQLSVIILHVILCKIFKVDSDSSLITSIAGVYGPPFIAPVAKVCNRSDLIAPGVICGALGLAIGTLLGFMIGSILLLL